MVFILFLLFLFSLPGQGRLSVESPIQPRPREDGEGLVHALCRLDRPQATALLHDDQLVHILQPPFTAKCQTHMVLIYNLAYFIITMCYCKLHFVAEHFVYLTEDLLGFIYE